MVCATNTSLMDRVNEGTFRLDLYYRLNVVRIEVPPLSAREGDIPLLAIHFLDKYTKRIGKEVHGITVGSRINSYCFYIHFFTSTYYTHCYFTPISY